MEYLSDIIQAEFCPKCNYEKTNFLIPDLSPPYIDNLPDLSSKQDLKRESLALKNIYSMLQN